MTLVQELRPHETIQCCPRRRSTRTHSTRPSSSSPSLTIKVNLFLQWLPLLLLLLYLLYLTPPASVPRNNAVRRSPCPSSKNMVVTTISERDCAGRGGRGSPREEAEGADITWGLKSGWGLPGIYQRRNRLTVPFPTQHC